MADSLADSTADLLACSLTCSLADLLADSLANSQARRADRHAALPAFISDVTPHYARATRRGDSTRVHPGEKALPRKEIRQSTPSLDAAAATRWRCESALQVQRPPQRGHRYIAAMFNAPRQGAHR
ncbi:hypothetical protein [Cupriavidus cauae]|uniref:Uncharacterized protein n=1 Tax=Cupriavidus cauae TaxID=2608999 RepID=A0A5M8A2I8_9BURK|nr:hypothetical protein [Cupriavidus cauae]KAA6117343.1 hypothetical protein F1599_23590 [Cupriavidus cauae]